MSNNENVVEWYVTYTDNGIEEWVYCNSRDHARKEKRDLKRVEGYRDAKIRRVEYAVVSDTVIR